MDRAVICGLRWRAFYFNCRYFIVENIFDAFDRVVACGVASLALARIRADTLVGGA